MRKTKLGSLRGTDVKRVRTEVHTHRTHEAYVDIYTDQEVYKMSTSTILKLVQATPEFEMRKAVTHTHLTLPEAK